MKVAIRNQKIKSVEFTPNYKGKMNRFKLIVEESKEQATVYLFTRREQRRTEYLKSILQKGKVIDAEVIIVQDPEYGGERNIAMITKIVAVRDPVGKSVQPQLPLTA